MNSILLPYFPALQLPFPHFSHRHQLQPLCISNTRGNRYACQNSSFPHSFQPNSKFSFHSHQPLIAAAVPSDEGPVSVINFEDLMEKDWSFLDAEESNSKEHDQNIGRIISAGEIEDTSRVLVSIGSEGFVDRLVDTSPCGLLLIVHDSLFLLVCVKEKYDKVKCWQGELIHVPEKWAPLDVVFLYFLPALPFELDEVFGTLAKRCSPGARLVISHPQGREVLEQQRKQYQDVVTSDLPDKMALQKTAADHSFEMVEYVDDPGFYLAVLRFSDARN
ncbi:unnamed protein product [Dovyalis caffra]|uniref:Uncharacterized protein n=1 Tax=Dovyalis caffra TaxID=77055 RepID=A0AAV1RY72_9ROSI|nr:unnamed protein product [Dovyalis caffra]